MVNADIFFDPTTVGPSHSKNHTKHDTPPKGKEKDYFQYNPLPTATHRVPYVLKAALGCFEGKAAIEKLFTFHIVSLLSSQVDTISSF